MRHNPSSANPPSKKATSPRMSQSDWLRLGIAQLKAEGSGGMTIDRLCQAAKRTKGSFYAHFTDINDFVAQITEYWRQLQTEQIIQSLPADPTTAHQRLDDLLEHIDWDLEHHMRLWAHVNPHVLHEVVEVDQRRVEFLSQLNRGLGLSAKHARTKALLAYFALIGHITLSASWPAVKRNAKAYSQSLNQALLREYLPSTDAVA